MYRCCCVLCLFLLADTLVLLFFLIHSFSETKIIEGIKELILTMGTLVPVEQVIDAFMLMIEDDSYNGDVARITPQYGISVIGRTPKPSKASKL